MQPLIGLWFFALPLFNVSINQTFAVTVPHEQGLEAQAGQTPDSPGVSVSPYGRLPVFFEPNRGQFDTRVRFASRSRDMNLFLTDSQAVLVAGTQPGEKTATTRSVTLSLVGANRTPRVTGLDELPGKVNYFRGQSPAYWYTNIPTFAKVRYADVYPGIDMQFRDSNQQLEFDFILAPGADPERITIAMTGQKGLSIQTSGDAILDLGDGALRLHKPYVYQQLGTEILEVKGAFRKDTAGNLRFQVAAYDRTLPLVIDPVVSYSSYLGGGSSGENNRGRAIAVHLDGSAYLTGYTTTADFPVTPGVFQEEGGTTASSTSSFDGFVARVSVDGSSLVYASYLAGEGLDIPDAIAVDDTGNAYVTGETQSDDFPITNGAFQTANCGSCAFLTKINPTGTAIVYSSYLGASLTKGRDVALDSSGNAYVMGYTSSTSFPTTAGVVQPNKMTGGSDAFITKFNSTGTALVYSTYLGGGSDELLSGLTGGIAVDAQGNAYVTGQTSSDDFPTVNAFQSNFGSSQNEDDAFVTKLNATGTALVYSTYLGGADDDAGQGIDIDNDNYAYVVGRTSSTDFPVSNALQPVFGGGSGQFAESFITKLSADGSSLVYSSYLGGSGSDEVYGVVVDAANQAHIVGKSLSSDFPTEDPIPGQPVGSSPVFISKLLSDGSGFVYSTRFGNGTARGMGIDLDSAGNAYITGGTISDTFPVVNAFQPGPGDASQNAFVTKFVDPLNLLAATLPGTRSVGVGDTATGFTTEINTSKGTAYGCRIEATGGLPVTFSYQTTDPSNQLTGSPNTPVSIPPGGSRNFLFAVTPTSPFPPSDVGLQYICDNGGPAPSTSANGFQLSSNTSPEADIVALVATPSGDGIVTIPASTGIGFFSLASINVGASDELTVSADTGDVLLPVTLTVCETNPNNSECLATPAPTVTTQIDANATPTFAVFVSASATVPFDPENNRATVRFKDSSDIDRGSASVAIRTE